MKDRDGVGRYQCTVPACTCIEFSFDGVCNKCELCGHLAVQHHTVPPVLDVGNTPAVASSTPVTLQGVVFSTLCCFCCLGSAAFAQFRCTDYVLQALAANSDSATTPSIARVI